MLPLCLNIVQRTASTLMAAQAGEEKINDHHVRDDFHGIHATGAVSFPPRRARDTVASSQMSCRVEEKEGGEESSARSGRGAGEEAGEDGMDGSCDET